ncbi:MAG: hypothetical protein H0T79_06880 [Deltaproteobacteria bacterium]|nr:hypothetical protein [Deltaproteobacteria bacterium]
MTLVERSFAIILLAASTFLVQLPTAHAQSAEAEVLFRDGRKLIKAGKLQLGCDKLDASARLEPSIGTLLNLGDCREKLGDFASSWAAFRKAEAMSKRAGGDDKRQLEAQRRATQLEPRLSNLVIQVEQRVDGLTIKRDGELVDPAAWNTPVPVDPDTYTIVAEAPGFTPWKSAIAVDAKIKRRVVVVPKLTRIQVAPPVEVAPVLQPRPAEPVVPPPRAVEPVATITYRERPSMWTSPRKVSAVLAIAGLGAVGTGLYFGVHATSLQGRADDRCPLAACADPDGLRLNDEARTAARRANYLYAGGAGALAVATVIWLVGGPDETVITPTIGAREAGVSFAGRF